MSLSEANQNFLKDAKIVDENGAAVILKNNSSEYILFGSDEFMALDSRNDSLMEAAQKVLEANKEAFKRLSE